MAETLRTAHTPHSATSNTAANTTERDSTTELQHPIPQQSTAAALIPLSQFVDILLEVQHLQNVADGLDEDSHNALKRLAATYDPQMPRDKLYDAATSLGCRPEFVDRVLRHYPTIDEELARLEQNGVTPAIGTLRNETANAYAQILAQELHAIERDAQVEIEHRYAYPCRQHGTSHTHYNTLCEKNRPEYLGDRLVKQETALFLVHKVPWSRFLGIRKKIRKKIGVIGSIHEESGRPQLHLVIQDQTLAIAYCNARERIETMLGKYARIAPPRREYELAHAERTPRIDS